ncbi:MAG: 4-demethylwyosine synthase TYW1 [Nanobdellota archaeon]
MITEEGKKSLEKQHYGVVGNHSAVKVCGWSKKMIRGEGSCYKHKFYGIKSNRCLQMTTSLSCANRCIYCWRDYKAPVSKEWKWDVDDPDFIIDESIRKQKKLLNGFWGNDKADKRLLKESEEPAHVALSLTGEAITYPKINEILRKFHERKISTFLVTNGTFPEKLEEIEDVTQLYISVDAPDKELAKDIGRPLFENSWERQQESLDIIREKDYRTCMRMTMIKEMNMVEPERYKHIIDKARPDFIEVKAYMFVGSSRQRLSIKNMPRHHEIREYSEKLEKVLKDYQVIDEHEPSRVVLLARKDMKDKAQIDFKDFFEKVLNK